MARPWRIEYEGALYHVFSRGNNQQDIFITDDDRYLFLDTIGQMSERFDTDIFAYVLMGNHYHLLLRTQKANLSRSLQINREHDLSVPFLHALWVKGWLLKGQIALADRQSGEAEKWLRQALTMAERIGNPTLRWKIHLTVGHLHAETKRPEMARQAYRAARNVIDGMKASTKNPELRASLESSPMFQEVYDLTTLD